MDLWFEGSTECKSVSVNGSRHVFLVLCAIVCYLAIYLSQLHFLPSTGTKVERDWKYNPRHSLIKAAIEFPKTPSQLQAKHQFSLSVHKAIWLGNNPVLSPLTIKLFEKGQLDAETKIKYKLYICTHQSHLPLPKANSRACGQQRENSWFPLKHSAQPRGRLVMPSPRPTGLASSKNCLHTDQGRDKHPSLFLYLL